MMLPQILRYAYAFFMFILFLKFAWQRAPRYPFFAVTCLATSFWMAVYDPANDTWLARWIVLLYCTLIPLRFLAVCEVLWHLGEGRRWLRVLLAGTGCLAVAWLIFAWELHGTRIGQLVQMRNYVQVATALLLLVPMVAFGLADSGNEEDMRHGRILLLLLSVHAAVSVLVIGGHRLSLFAWHTVDDLSYVACLWCCCMWLTPPAARFSLWQTVRPRVA